MAAAPASQAATTLALRVVRGGLDLDFGMLEPGEPVPTQELEVAVTSTNAAQYRVYQECPGGLVNERGARLPEGAWVMQMSRGMTGTSAGGGILPVAAGTQELFISNASGQSDTLLLAYSVRLDQGVPAGTYRGLLRFTVESRSTGALTAQTVNVRMTITARLQLEREPTAAQHLSFGTVAPGERSRAEETALTVVNSARTAVQLLHELAEPLSNGQGAVLPPETLMVQATSPNGPAAWRSVTTAPDVLVADDAGTVGSLRLAYAVSVPADQPAGIYRGMLRLRLGQAGASPAGEILLPVDLDVKEVFTISVVPSDGAQGLNFGRPTPGTEPVERRITVAITTNMGRPYQVLAGLDHPLVLPSGETLPASALTWSVRDASRGKPLAAPNSAVPVGFEPVFASDAGGSSATFMLAHRLAIPVDARDGTYTGQIHFTITVF